ncbi:hypothetical protein [Streptomyces sp. ME19-01-6]|uniref:WD40 repeat domain-containing protein n=1 Tax=Streptomyces sp. ME19-01-6 TaxID=3028686 RepID=UPI0029BDF72D|nr:hypothetical protein [Streptomyces sp. ME19-01-6]MDX3225327.1 hypothetical protein [Streptomyces sp. ME19-01-6]
MDFVSGKSSPDRTVRLGDESSGWVQGVAFSADETRMFVAHDSKVYVIEPATGRILVAITVPGDWLNSPAASPDGAYLAVATEDWNDERKCTPDIYRVADRELIMRRPARDRLGAGIRTQALAWSPDGARLAAIVENEKEHRSLGGTFPAVTDGAKTAARPASRSTAAALQGPATLQVFRAASGVISPGTGAGSVGRLRGRRVTSDQKETPALPRTGPNRLRNATL